MKNNMGHPRKWRSLQLIHHLGLSRLHVTMGNQQSFPSEKCSHVQGSYLPSVLEENEKDGILRKWTEAVRAKFPKVLEANRRNTEMFWGQRWGFREKWPILAIVGLFLTVVPKEIGRVMEAHEGFGGVFGNAHEKHRRKIRPLAMFLQWLCQLTNCCRKNRCTRCRRRGL
jgi:hypothetical protein